MSSTAELLWRMIRLAVTVALVSAEFDEMGWKATYNVGPSYSKPPQCVDIPDDLRLCYDVGYPQMLLPNLLDHETMAEVKQQASSWVPLVHKRCHPSTQILLCSLFAPVCLERPIYPCRVMCEAVRAGCTPIMEAFGFPWPEMLTCDKFPTGDMCISINNASEVQPAGSPNICPPCDNEMKTDAIIEHMCASEFAVKGKIKEVKNENTDRKVILQKRKKIVKSGSLRKKDLKNLVLYLKNGADCPCQQLDNLGNQYLIMFRKVEKQYLLTGIHKWDKNSKEFRKVMKRLRTYRCPTYANVFK
ncbi:secreted frizzled-related protein 1a [Anabas testudineus]|uniref:Secreted frizzled-related protein 1 n=1 Tax=Anabas testudineus TaxID=64144 RepID=A0A3Q1JT37_ANATE|nr:secreted frizzled-related protein 1a [Anabas testudineus]